MNWWQLQIQEVFSKTTSSSTGLNDEQFKSRLAEAGPNELLEKKRKPFTIFLNQFKDFIILVLLAAAIIARIAGDMTDTIIIVVIVVLNAVVGFVQENKAERAMEALKKISALQAHVMRGGKVITVASSELVQVT
jgi:P-type Ca2+ transporter type 2C